MRRALRATLVALASIVTVGLSISAASAADPVDDAITALQQTSVFVEPGTSGTDPDTTDYLQKFLEPDDHIVIVMINESPMTDDAVAQAILGSLPEPSILGLYVNGQISVHNSRDSIPESAVNTTMDSAKAISMNAPETLTTFTRLMHRYQAEHPEPITETSTTTSTTPDTTSSVVPVGGGILLFVVIVAAVIALRRRKRTHSDPYVLRASPPNVREQLLMIKQLLSQVDDVRVAAKLREVIKDTEAFFARTVSSRKHDTPKETGDFQRTLAPAIELLDLYIDIQQNPRYYENSPKLLESGARAVDDLAADVLAAVRRGNTEALLKYQVNRQLLEAKRYR